MLSWNYKWHVKLSGNSLNLAESQSAESHQRKSSQQLHFVRSFVRSRNEARGFTVDDFRPRAQNSRTSKWTWNIFGTFQWTIPIEEWLKLQLWTLCPAEFKGKKTRNPPKKTFPHQKRWHHMVRLSGSVIQRKNVIQMTFDCFFLKTWSWFHQSSSLRWFEHHHILIVIPNCNKIQLNQTVNQYEHYIEATREKMCKVNHSDPMRWHDWAPRTMQK